MVYGGKEDGGATFTLTPEEHERFKAGKQITRLTGDNKGIAHITIKMTRPRSNEKRYPAQMGYSK